MEVVLVMFKADGHTRSFPLTRDVTVMGRREDCDLRIPLTEVSRKHCRLVKEGDSLRIEDLGSSNGTFQNGQRIQEALLRPGDYIQVGPVVFAVQIDGLPAADAIRPPEAGQNHPTADDAVSPQAATAAPASALRPDTPEDLLPPQAETSGAATDDLFVVADDANEVNPPEDVIIDLGQGSDTENDR